MSPAALGRAVSCLRDSVAEPQIWAEALPFITDALDASGACCFACNDQTGGIEWFYIAGPLTDRISEYIEYYAPLDLYKPIVTAPSRPGWQTLSEIGPTKCPGSK